MKHPLHMRRARRFPQRLDRTLRELPRPAPFSLQPHERRRSNSEAAVVKEQPLKVIVRADACKAIMAKI